MGKKTKTSKNMVAPKGYWQTPWQKSEAAIATWNKLEKEDIDLEEFKKKKCVTYFNREPDVMLRNDYDRLFHPDDDFDPKVKIKDIRNKIIKEEEERTIPVVVSHMYGHRYSNLEGKTWTSHKRIVVMSEIYRRYKPNLKPEKKLPRSYQIEKL
ncbi:unnamed protein product [Nezara viridula]|uniref:Uncharacterized protein n=1 Tax=Nezara viridula TaxID=85310 RepID=A0A9P0H2Q3_NEZVI|nr:unnamed protein product [Nezara viridula]